ncbi:MAG: carboxymuconolactone decarboxylase family protein [Catenulispora sp.]
MRPNLVRKALRPLSFLQVRHVSPVRGGGADERVPAIYQEMERLFGVISPPVALHSPAPDMLAATWMIMSETLLVNGVVDRNVKEAVATAVSVGNECPYCVTVHGTMMRALGYDADATALARGSVADIADPEIRAVSAWIRATANPGSAVGDDTEPPFPPEQAPEILGVALVFHYFNRMVNVFLPDAPMPPRAPAAIITVVLPVLGRFLRSAHRNTAPLGGTLGLLPEAPLPPDLAWATDNPTIADALSRAGAAYEEAGRRAVPPAVRDLVRAELAAWDGQPKGMSRSWVEDAIGGLPAADRPAGRLALLIALASYQVDQGALDAFRATAPGDATLVELASWASFTASVRAAGRMVAPVSGA